MPHTTSAASPPETSWLLPPPKMASKESKRFGHKPCTTAPASPQTWHNQEHNTMGTHLTIFEMALGPFRPFAVPRQYIRRGARRGRTHPCDNTTPFPWTSPNSRAPRQVLPRCRSGQGYDDREDGDRNGSTGTGVGGLTGAHCAQRMRSAQAVCTSSVLHAPP